MYVKPETEIDVCTTIHKYSSVGVGSISLGSYNSRSHTSSILCAQWNPQLFGLSSSSDCCELRPLQINYFAKHSVTIGNQTLTHLVFVKWFEQHPKKNSIGKPVTVWEHDLFQLENFIPIQLLRNRTVSVIDNLSDIDGKVLFISTNYFLYEL